MNLKSNSNLKNLRRVLRGAWPKRFAILEAFFWNLVASVTRIGQIALVKTAVDAVVAQDPMSTLLAPFFLLTACLLLMVGAEALHRWKMTVIIQRLTLDMQDSVHRKLHKMSDQSLTDESPGELAFRTLQDTAACQQTVGIVIGTIIAQLIIVIALGSYLFYLNWQVALVTISGYAIMAPIVRYGTRSLQVIARELQERRAALQQRFLNLFAGRDVIRCFDLPNKQVESLPKANDRFHVRAKRYLVRRALIDSTTRLAAVLYAMVVVLYIGWLVRQGRMSLGSTAAVTAILFAFYRPITRLAHAGSALRESLVSAQRVFEILDAPVYWQKRNGQVVPANQIESVAFDQVRYRIVERDFTLRDLSFSLRAGEIALLVGPTGCGKTTIIRLLTTILTADRGTITFNGLPADRICQRWLWSNLAYIPQQCPAIGQTIREELDLSGQNLDDSILEQAARKAELHDWISGLPEGWETQIGTDGVALSGGQLQRLALARAFLASRSLYVLDEPTSQLDQETEKRIITTLFQHIRSRNAMGFIASHRPAFVNQVNCVLVIHNDTLFQALPKDVDSLFFKLQKDRRRQIDPNPEILV